MVLAGIAVAVLLAAIPASAAAHPMPGAPASGASGPIRAASIKLTIGIGKDADGLTYDPSTFDVYVANQGSNNVSVISSATHAVSSISVGKSPYGVTYDPYNGKIYVPNFNSSNLSIISGSTNKVVANPSLGAHAKPIGSVFDPASGGVLVFNSSAGSLNIDGVNNMSTGFQTMAYIPLVDAVQETVVDMTPYDAGAVGFATAGNIDVHLKSGTNTFHGEAFSFFRDQTLTPEQYLGVARRTNWREISSCDRGSTERGAVCSCTFNLGYL